MTSRKNKITKSKYLVTWLALLSLSGVRPGVCQETCVPFLVVFEYKKQVDPTFEKKIVGFLEGELAFSKKITYIPENDWLLFNEEDEALLMGHFDSEHPEAGLIFRFMVEKVPGHINPNLSLLRLDAFDLRHFRRISLSDSYIANQDLNILMPLVISHMKSIAAGKPEKRPLYIIEDSSLAQCNNYKSTVMSFLLSPVLFREFYILLQPNTKVADNNNIMAKVDQNHVDRFELLLRKRQDIIDHARPQVECYSNVDVFRRQFDNYCQLICRRYN